MTIAVFTFSLLGAMALDMPIAFALIVCGIALIVNLSNSLGALVRSPPQSRNADLNP